MASISNLKVGENLYNIKDTTARTTAENADTKADQAILDSASASSTANTANTNANNALSKINGSKIIGNYTESTETLEIALEIGGNQ